MKPGTMLATVAALLLMNSVAVVASPPPVSTKEAPAQVPMSSATPLDLSPNCLGNILVTEPSPYLPPREATTWECGPCSVDLCLGRSLGDECFFFGVPWTCSLALGGPLYCGEGMNSGRNCDCREPY